MRIDDLDYDLPEALIAQEPAERRDASRLMILDRRTGTMRHGTMSDLPGYLEAGDLMVLNDTRVLPARLLARRDTGGRVEVLLLERPPDQAPGRWCALAKAGGKLRAGEVLRLDGGAGIRLLAALEGGQWLVEGVDADLRHLMVEHGRMPLPPYIRREEDDAREALDRERYQTVYASTEGAVAAPTAGLHLTPELFRELEQRGVGTTRITLHVGLGTFEPVRVERLEEHVMHEEAYRISTRSAAAVRAARASGGRIVAVGTTSVRTLEAAVATSPDGLPAAGEGRTDLLIAPGYRFHAVDVLLTNFHLPRSTLIALVAAFAGLERILDAYREAVREGYRFYSYGDAMLIL